MIRKIDSLGEMTVIAGQEGKFLNKFPVLDSTEIGDGGAATAAMLWYPSDVAVDNFGNIFIADYNYNRIRKVDETGIIQTFAGTGEGATTDTGAGDGGPAVEAVLYKPMGVFVDGDGNVIVTENLGRRVRRIEADIPNDLV